MIFTTHHFAGPGSEAKHLRGSSCTNLQKIQPRGLSKSQNFPSRIRNSINFRRGHSQSSTASQNFHFRSSTASQNCHFRDSFYAEQTYPNLFLSDIESVLQSDFVPQSEKVCTQLCNNWAKKHQTCILKLYLSLGCCWKHCGLHFEDSWAEALFLDENYFRSKGHTALSFIFAVLQLLACGFYIVVMSHVRPNDGSYINNLPILIGSGVDGVLMLLTHLIELHMSKGGRSDECVQLWHIVRMAIGCLAAVVFYLGGFFTMADDLYFWDLELSLDETIGGAVVNVSKDCGHLYLVNPDGGEYDWICAFFAQNWQYCDFIFVSAGPQTLFLHSLPARLTLPILILELTATFLIFYFPSLRRGNKVLFIYLAFYQLCFGLGLGLVTITAEQKSRLSFRGQAKWNKLQANFIHRLDKSKSLEDQMEKSCPDELKWIRQVGDDSKDLHKVSITSTERLLYLGKFRREMHGLDNFRIPAENIEEFPDEKLGRGGQADVFKGTWKKWTGSMHVAIKKWGSRKPKERVDGLKKYQNEVEVLIKLKKHK